MLLASQEERLRDDILSQDGQIWDENLHVRCRTWGEEESVKIRKSMEALILFVLMKIVDGAPVEVVCRVARTEEEKF